MATCNCNGRCRTGQGCLLGGTHSFIGYAQPVQTSQQPWICPRCTKVNAPWKPSCCSENKEN